MSSQKTRDFNFVVAVLVNEVDAVNEALVVTLVVAVAEKLVVMVDDAESEMDDVTDAEMVVVTDWE